MIKEMAVTSHDTFHLKFSPRPPHKARCEITNLDMCGFPLQGEKFLLCVCIFLSLYISMGSGHSKMPCANSGTGMLLNKPYLGTILKQTDLVSSFFPLYGSLASCLHYLNTEANK